MFKKLHRQMTIFASLITSGILILMAVSCLVISERGLTHNTYERFLNNGNTCVAYLENQTVLSHKWILEAKQEYKVEFRILNNGKKLYFDKLDTESWNQDKKEENQISNEKISSSAKSFLEKILKEGFISKKEATKLAMDEGLFLNVFINNINDELFEYINDQTLVIEDDRILIDEFYREMVKELIDG